jgi:hypothetical protein
MDVKSGASAPIPATGQQVARPPKKRYPEQRQLEAAINELALPNPDRMNLSRRYLDYMDWLEGAAVRSRRAYYTLRLTAVIIAAVVPALVAANLQGAGRTVTVILGVIVAATTAIEAFLHLGDRWRHYRLTVERLKAQAWQFVQGAGPYAAQAPREALSSFVVHMEKLIEDEVNNYVSTVVTERATRQLPRGRGSDTADDKGADGD